MKYAHLKHTQRKQTNYHVNYPIPINRHTNLQRNNRMKRDAQVQLQTSTFEMKRCNGSTTIVLFLLNNCSQPTYDVSWKQT